MLKAFACDDSDLYAARDADEAIRLWKEHNGETAEMDDGYPVELSDEDLDKPIPAFDENENRTGEMTSVRQFLIEHGDEPGWLAGSDY